MSTEIQAPMPGSIFKILAQVGDEVVEGQEVIVLEAMKMENPIITTEAGKVAELKVSEGDKVATKQVLMIIE